MNNYDLEYIDKLRIHELRDYARKLGVSSPTTLKKKSLIDKITTIIASNEKHELVGEPHNTANKDFDFFDLLICENTTLLDNLISQSQNKNKAKSPVLIKKSSAKENLNDNNTYQPFVFTISQNKAEFGQDDYYVVSGYVDIHPNGYGILRCNGFVPSEDDAYFTLKCIQKKQD